MVVAASMEAELRRALGPAGVMIFEISFYLDLMILYFLFLLSYIRQARLCCKLGFCRFYLWMTFVLLVGLITMGIPFVLLIDFRGASWCTISSNISLHAATHKLNAALLAGRK